MNGPNDQLTSTPDPLDLTEAEALIMLAARTIETAAKLNHRIAIGIAGGPGCGKSTIAEKLIGILDKTVPGSAARLPMDGFHLPHAELVAAGTDIEKGTPQTFDAEKFIALLTELKSATGPMSIPSYSRVKEDIVPDAFTIAQNVPIVIVEGNYLLLADPPWDKVRELLDYSVYLHVPRDKIRARLLKRHAEHGLFTKDRNIAHVDKVDLANYDLVSPSKSRADLIINLMTDL